MRKHAQRAQLVTALFAVGVVLGLALGASKVAPAAQKGNQPKPPAAPELIGALSCKQCHNEEKPEQNPLYKATLGFEFVRLSENRVWGAHDLHSRAFENLKVDNNATARRMQEKLRHTRGKEYEVTKDVACLACHASHTKLMSEEPPAKWTVESFSPEDGVGCEMCHGHGSAYRDKHQVSRLAKGGPAGATRVVDWREWDPKAKQEWGLVNLRDPLVATARCASCHVGNKDEGRFVTHEMFAAGHPPLPPLDLMAYAREQPRHWGWPTEMKYLTDLAQADPKKAMDVFHFRGGESFGTRRFAESAIASLHATAISTGQLAASAKEDGGLDYAAFDCFSCHHELKYPSERQARGYVGRPGRPLFRPAPFALARVVVEHAATMTKDEGLKQSATKLGAIELQLADAFTRKSLGDPELIAKATKALAEWSQDTLAKLGKLNYDRKATHGLLTAVTKAATDAENPVADPEVAQVYSWAVETLVLELAPKPEDATPPEVLTQMHEKLKGVVVTRLRPNAPFYYEQLVGGAAAAEPLQPVDARIKSRMETYYGFRGATFLDVLGKLEMRFPKP
jgi:hypothetical protein